MWDFVKKSWKWVVGLLAVQAAAGVKIDSNVIDTGFVPIVSDNPYYGGCERKGDVFSGSNYDSCGIIQQDLENGDENFNKYNCFLTMDDAIAPRECNETVVVSDDCSSGCYNVKITPIFKNKISVLKVEPEKSFFGNSVTTIIKKGSFYCQLDNKVFYRPPFYIACEQIDNKKDEKIEINNNNTKLNN